MEDSMANDVFICKGCGEIKTAPGHLCDPVEMKEAHVCEDCGAHSKDPRHICKPMLTRINYVCVSCGRVADLPKKLCNPRDLEKLAKEEPPNTIF
jgi:DNA-directed RNA polymerase subunit RPC12/RpoP